MSDYDCDCAALFPIYAGAFIVLVILNAGMLVYGGM